MENKKTYSSVFIVISGLYIACLLISNIIAGKLWQITEGAVVPASVILFPVTYIIGDILTEVYGFQKAKSIIWLGFICSFFATIAYTVTIILPSPSYFEKSDAYKVVLGTTPRIAFASLLAYLFGAFSNSIVLSRLKTRTKGRMLWIRTILSTVVGEGFDTIIFITISFGGTMSIDVLLGMMIGQYLCKVLYEAVLTPVTYPVIGFVKRREGVDAFDYNVKYKFFGRDKDEK